MGKYCHYLCFIDGKSESKILFKVTQDPGPQSQSEREIGDIYLIFPLKVSICWMNKIYILNKDLGSELVKITPPFFFPFEKNAIKTLNLLVFRSASRESRSAEKSSSVLSMQRGNCKRVLPSWGRMDTEFHSQSCISAWLYFEPTVRACLSFRTVKVPTNSQQIWIVQTESPDWRKKSPKNSERYGDNYRFIHFEV